MHSSVWFVSKSYVNTDRKVHLPVNLGIANLMLSALLVLYFRFAPFHPSYFEAFSGGFAVSAVVDVSMEPVVFSVIYSCFDIWTNRFIVSLSRVTFKIMFNPLPFPLLCTYEVTMSLKKPVGRS